MNQPYKITIMPKTLLSPYSFLPFPTLSYYYHVFTPLIAIMLIVYVKFKGVGEQLAELRNFLLVVQELKVCQNLRLKITTCSKFTNTFLVCSAFSIVSIRFSFWSSSIIVKKFE